MKTTKRVLFAALALFASALLIQSANAQCSSQGTIYAIGGQNRGYQLADAGQLCGNQPVTVHLPGNQHALALCVFSGGPIKVELAIINDPILGTPMFGNYVPPATAVIGGQAGGQCFEIPAAIANLRVSVPADTSANVSLGVSF